MNSGIPQCLQHTVVWTLRARENEPHIAYLQNRFGLYDTARFVKRHGAPLALIEKCLHSLLEKRAQGGKRMEIRKPGAAELKPALALAWDVFLKDAASGFSDEGIRTFKRFIE